MKHYSEKQNEGNKKENRNKMKAHTKHLEDLLKGGTV